MGNFNEQYDKYYKTSTAAYKSGASYTYGKTGEEAANKFTFLFRRLIVDLSGTLILFIILILCKNYNVPQTAFIYKNAKNYVNDSFDYKKAFNEIQNISFSDIEKNITNYIEKIKNKISGDTSINSEIKKNYIPPLKGKITSKFGMRINPITKEKEMHEGIDIDAKEGTKVLVSYDGVVSKCGTDKSMGNFVIVDHSHGVKTKYEHLSSVLVKNDEKVKKSDVIGKSGSTGDSTAPHLHFELIGMGKNLNPLDYISFT